MRFIIPVFVFICFIVFFGFSLHASLAVGLWTVYAYDLFNRSSKMLAFREFILVLYGTNYLLSPALTYHDPGNAGPYGMRIQETRYFELAIPCMLLLQAGLFFVKTKIFSINYQLIHIQGVLNQKVLKVWLFVGLGLSLTSSFFPGELGFFVYLVSMIRFIGAFGLFAIDRKKYRWLLIAVLFLEISRSIAGGMFHDMVMWFIFFGLFWTYLAKPTAFKKITLAVIAVLSFLVLQVAKNDYRDQTWRMGQEGSFSTFKDVALENITSDEGFFNESNLGGSISRVNQAWILASTINHMDRIQDFQQLHLLGLYVEAAVLPRFMAPNKLTSGNKEIFNKFSGHRLNKGTSMGLGAFADGYIAFGYWGALSFALALGLLFSLVFKIVESWATISPFFVFFVFPILNYAVRPDCETQTIITHLVKSLIVYGLMIAFYRKYFTRKVYILRKKEERNASRGTMSPASASA